LRSPFGIHHPDSAASIGLVPFDLSDPAGVERMEQELSVGDAAIDGMFAGCPRHRVERRVTS
jgi:hypothetical protein